MSNEVRARRWMRTERRLDAIEAVLRDLLRENAHILVGGVAFAEDSLARLAEADTPRCPCHGKVWPSFASLGAHVRRQPRVPSEEEERGQ